MQVKSIPSSHLSAACAVLNPYIPDLSPTALVAALRAHGEADSPPRLLDKHQAAELLGISWWSLVDKARKGKVPGARKVGGTRWRFDESELLSWGGAE